MGLGEAADAVDAVDEHDDDADGEVQHGVEFEFVEVADDEEVDDEELEGDVEDLDIGVDIHLLVGDDAGVVGGLGDAEHGAEDAALVDPVGGGHAPLGDDELVAEEPQADGLGEDEDDGGDADVDDQRTGEGVGKAGRGGRFKASPGPSRREGRWV